MGSPELVSKKSKKATVAASTSCALDGPPSFVTISLRRITPGGKSRVIVMGGGHGKLKSEVSHLEEAKVARLGILLPFPAELHRSGEATSRVLTQALEKAMRPFLKEQPQKRGQGGAAKRKRADEPKGGRSGDGDFPAAPKLTMNGFHGKYVG